MANYLDKSSAIKVAIRMELLDQLTNLTSFILCDGHTSTHLSAHVQTDRQTDMDTSYPTAVVFY